MPSAISPRRVAFGLWIAVFPLFAVMLFWPVNSRSLRLGIILVIFVIMAGSLVFSWRRRAAFASLFGIYAAIGLFLLLPGSPGESGSHLRKSYVEAMSAYEGVPYVWGGESRFGMDCSGLVRKGLQNTLCRTGILTLNPSLARAAVDLWWNDNTAAGIGKGYDGRTVHVTDCSSLNEIDPATLQPGDLAVTTSGVHVMAYLGNNRWIGADPGEEKVTVFTVPEAKNGWFSCPMNIVRWRLIKG